MDFSLEILNWYNLNKRELPWRNTNDAYLIWLSEIILQQTRVAQGMPYYFKFVNRFANINCFAEATEDEILNLWQGLGYYSRGRNMLKTAIAIKNNYGGVFPTAYADLIGLVGIGEYTAAAISSFSVNEIRAVVDGNVYRVLARYFGINTPINSTAGKKEFQNLANILIDIRKPALYNQAIMEFGALLCKPKNPNCAICNLNLNCLAFQQNKVNQLPVKLKKVKIRERFLNFFVVKDADNLIMKKRDNTDIWAGLYDFPLIETTTLQPIGEVFATSQFDLWFKNNVEVIKIGLPVKHILTHQIIYARFIEIAEFKSNLINPNNWIRIPINQLENYAQPKLIFAFLKNYLN